MRKIFLLLAFLLGGGLAAATVCAGDAKAEEMTWRLKSSYEYKVQVEFYSQDRKHAWPGGNQAYGLNDYKTHEFTLSCIAGEKICYGAWPTGGGDTYWGVGPNNKYNCKGCCAICGRDNPYKELLND